MEFSSMMSILISGFGMTLLILPPGGFFVFGVLMALVVWLEEKTGHRKERKAGCEGCPSADACQGKECEG